MSAPPAVTARDAIFAAVFEVHREPRRDADGTWMPDLVLAGPALFYKLLMHPGLNDPRDPWTHRPHDDQPWSTLRCMNTPICMVSPPAVPDDNAWRLVLDSGLAPS